MHMPRVIRISFALSAAALAAACTQMGSPKVDLAAEDAAVRAASAKWLAAVQAKDGAAHGATFTADGVSLMDGQDPMTGPAANQASLEAMYAAMPSAAVSWGPDKVVVAASGDLAYEVGSATITTEGQPAFKGHYVTVWQKVNGEWKAAVDVTVNGPPDSAAAGAPAK